MSRHKKTGPSVRLLRVNESLRHELSAILLREDLRDPVLKEASITVSEVRCSPDLRQATAFVMPLGGKDTEEILKALQRAAPYLSGVLGRRVQLKFSPKLTFKADTTFDESEKINRLLAQPGVARDLDRKD